MAVLLIVAADFVKTGGMDRANYALADYAARSGWEVHLVGHSAGSALLARPEIRWHPVVRPWGHDALAWGRLRRAGERWARTLAPRGARVLVNGGNCPWPDANWVHYVHAAFTSPLHGGPLRQVWQQAKHRRARRDERRALQCATAVIANSERTRRDLIERVGVAPERIVVIYYGSDPERFHSFTADERRQARERLGWPPQRRVALFVGALGDRRKGFDVLFRAWSGLCGRTDWDVDLVAVGRGGELEAWRERTAAAGLGSRIRLLGFRRDIPALLAAGELLIAPARYEAYGLGVHEALACGLPVLVSASAGIAERLPTSLEDWRLQDAESSRELEQKLLNWRREAERPSPSWHGDLTQFATRLREQTWDQMAEQILQLPHAAGGKPLAARAEA